MGALREKNLALVQLLKMETSKEPAVEQPSTATATTVFLEQFTATMGALREKNCDLAHLLKVQEIPHLLLVVVGDKMNALNQNDKS
jgi:hypothetical protein